jgi:hypothetical protein
MPIEMPIDMSSSQSTVTDVLYPAACLTKRSVVQLEHSLKLDSKSSARRGAHLRYTEVKVRCSV